MIVPMFYGLGLVIVSWTQSSKIRIGDSLLLVDSHKILHPLAKE